MKKCYRILIKRNSQEFQQPLSVISYEFRKDFILMEKTKNILIVGVGGQGTLLASKIIGGAMLARGYDVKVSEVHGMAQRGGSVVTYVRYGGCVDSPMVDAARADIIIAFEQLEAYRYLPYLKEGGSIITSDQQIDPMPVICGAAQYPANIIGEIKEKGINCAAVPALDLAREAGSEKAVNVVLLGVFAKLSGFDKDEWKNVILKSVPEVFAEVNGKAFELGYAHSGQ